VPLEYIGQMVHSRDIVSVERVIPAPAEAIFNVLADPARHPEIDGSGSVRAARPDNVQRLSKGATFGMSMRRGMPYGILNTVTEFDEGRRIAWEPRLASGPGSALGGRVWRYELEPADNGTLVRETWDISRESLRGVLRYVAGSRTRQDMEKSLERLETLVAPAPAPG
jgi:uncharacterized protein YndB with AHSA1/START domain